MPETKWKPSGKDQVLQTYANLHKRKLVGEHWLWVALERVANGENEAEVMADYGYIEMRLADKMPPISEDDVDLWKCTKCGRIGTVGRCCGEDTRVPYRLHKPSWK